MGRREQQKGKRYERMVAKKLAGLYPDARRNQDERTDREGQDLINTGPLMVQCKAWKKYPPITALFEVTTRARQLGKVPALVVKGDHQPSVVVLLLDDFIEMVKE